MSAFGAYEVNVRPVDYFFGVLALAWHVYIVLAVLYVFLLSFLLVWLGVRCFDSFIYILYTVYLWSDGLQEIWITDATEGWIESEFTALSPRADTSKVLDSCR